MSELQAKQRIDEALAGLKQLVEQAVREEQLIDRLTKLGNDESLTGWIEDNIDLGWPFWLAFVEVDRFKSVNDEFGYEAADELLRRVADQLRNGATNYFSATATPFRAHGDEFFIGGPGEGDDVHQSLDQIRQNIEALRVAAPVEPGSDAKRMRCCPNCGDAVNRPHTLKPRG